MPRNIVILLDGTSNQIAEDRTNVLRLYGVLEKSERQLVYYDPGVGTLGAEDNWLRYWRKAVEIWGLATGWGLDQKVKLAYGFLAANWRDGGDGSGGEPDSIYILGFSRGAYSARVLAGFIHAVGLVEPRNANLIDYAYRAYKRIGEGNERRGQSTDLPENPFGEVRLYERILQPRRPAIRLLGLFDTVASVFEMGRYAPRLRSHAFTRSNPSVACVRHAAAIDERRTLFRPQLWPQSGTFRPHHFSSEDQRPQDIREVWFSGCHCDVGGGLPERQSQLAKTALSWMIAETGPIGLHFVPALVERLVLTTSPDGRYLAPDGQGDVHESMNWAWGILEFIPRRKPADSQRPAVFGLSIPLFERRHIPEGARIWHEVLTRGTRPANLPVSYVEEHPQAGGADG